MVLIHLENACLELGHRLLLQNINLEIKKGDVLCVLGSNGSGKSTLLKLLAGQHWHTSGKRSYHFAAVPRESPIGAPIALVAPEMQERYQRLEHDRSALEVLATGFAQTDFLYTPLSQQQEQKLFEFVERLELFTLLEQSFFTLSKGQMRQILLARAMLGMPQVLLLDEFFSGIDTAARLRLREMVQEFLRQKGTLVYTTHRAEEPFAAHERVLELHKLPKLAIKSKSRAQRTHAQIASAKSKIPLIEIENANVFLGRLEDDATASDGHRANEPRQILHNICFCLFKGEDWLITGHNGAGKSTFANLLRGDLAPALGGVVRWFGREQMPIWERHATIALVSSDIQYAHRVDATGFEIIASGFFGGIGWHRDLEPKQNARVLELANALEMQYLLERNALYASQGELRKLLLARALVTKPKVIILDEAFDYLDTYSRGLVWRLLQSQPSTKVVIAHFDEDMPPFAVRHLEIAGGVAAIRQ